jgi:hypothetical protein
MDPFLEHPEVFPNLHDRFVTHLGDALQAKLPEPYFAASGSRVWIEFTSRLVGPDVPVLRTTNGPQSAAALNGGVAIENATRVRPGVVRVEPEEKRQAYLEIFTRESGRRRLVTSIELLSPTNKTPGEQGADLYRKKQREVLGSQVNLIEIDLLRAGQHTTAVPLEQAVRTVGAFHYHVCVRAFDRPNEFFVYAARLQDKLPEIAIPLLPGDLIVVIDLQAVFTHVYDTGPYRRWVRYDEPVPPPPLTSEELNWVSAQLRAGGF